MAAWLVISKITSWLLFLKEFYVVCPHWKNCETSKLILKLLISELVIWMTISWSVFLKNFSVVFLLWKQCKSCMLISNFWSYITSRLHDNQLTVLPDNILCDLPRLTDLYKDVWVHFSHMMKHRTLTGNKHDFDVYSLLISATNSRCPATVCWSFSDTTGVLKSNSPSCLDNLLIPRNVTGL
jgi:hypothetical protein